MLTAVDTVDGVLRDHEAELGSDYAVYRNHVYRVLNFCVAQSSPSPESLEKIAVAAAFHDLGKNLSVALVDARRGERTDQTASGGSGHGADSRSAEQPSYREHGPDARN